LKVVDLPSNVDPQSSGAAYFTVPAGTAVTPSTTSVIHQGTLEASNVNPIISVVELMSAQGDVETMRRAISMISSEMDKTAAQDLPHVS
jgi:flagellar basal-body rod protein FlgF